MIREPLLGAPAVDELDAWCRAVEAWPAGSHRWGHYAEQTASGAAICRTENVSACHSGVEGLVDGPLADLASRALGEQVTAFKDKVNYKQPGGAGFLPHQDRRAYPGAETVVSVLLAVDACDRESGCLWMADDVGELLAVDDRGVVRSDVAEGLEWEAAELAPGEAVVIHGLAPHYSDANRSARPRRVLVASYAPAREGYRREHYYRARGEVMEAATASDARYRISTLADFDGVEVAGTTTSELDRCRHA